MRVAEGPVEVYRNVCPRNCYASCSILSYVQNGRLLKVEGDVKHGFTRGKLCAKGYAYTQYVYSPDRLRYPLRQSPRGSGNWRRISWDEALGQISGKILELYRRYGSNLSLAYNKCSGNIGVLSSAVEGMFNGLGAHTKPVGNPCMAAGDDALAYDYGAPVNLDPENMAFSRLIVLWGANPAWTATQQLAYINAARERGACLVVIDPIMTATAAKADIYIQLNPGTDGLLALAVCKLLLERNAYDADFLARRVSGWESFAAYLRHKVDVRDAEEVTGVGREVIEELAGLYADSKPCANWVGFGLQRHANGGQNVRAINALTVLTGNVDQKGAGLYYFNAGENLLPGHLLQIRQDRDPLANQHRYLDLNRFASQAMRLSDPPLKLLWLANRNIASQDQDFKAWREFVDNLELIVTADLFMTETAKLSDLVLPVASAFEEWDLSTSYWHYWLALNQKAISPYFEAKSDLEIARALTRRLNQEKPGFSAFPAEKTALDWVKGELTPEVLAQYGLQKWEELLEGPRKLRETGMLKNSGILNRLPDKIRLYSDEAKINSLPALPRFWPRKVQSRFPLRLLTPQSLLRIHSQYAGIGWLAQEPRVELNPEEAAKRRVAEGETVRIYNGQGSTVSKLRINPLLPEGILIAYQGDPGVNELVDGVPTDMGLARSGSASIAFYDTWVDLRKV